MSLSPCSKCQEQEGKPSTAEPHEGLGEGPAATTAIGAELRRIGQWWKCRECGNTFLNDEAGTMHGGLWRSVDNHAWE